MNLKKAFAGLITGAALLGSLAAPSAIEASPPTTSASVNVQDGGIFTVAFCGAVTLTQAPGGAPTAETPGIATGGLGICYTADTKSYRDSFTVGISAGVFSSNSTSTTIAPSNLSVSATYNVGALHYTGNPPVVPRYGDIGYYVNEQYVAQVNNFDPQPWGPGFTLDTTRLVNFGYAGRGVGQAIGLMNLKLNIPSGTAAGTYTSELTLTITMGATP